MDRQIDQYEVLLQAFDIMVAEKIWHDVTASKLLRILMFLHSKGWLYMPVIDGEAQAVIAAYRVKSISDESLTQIPQNEEGTVLYVPMAISLKKEENMYKIVRESLKIYLEDNPDITDLVLEDKNEKLKIYNLKGDKNGKAKVTLTAATTDISRKR